MFPSMPSGRSPVDVSAALPRTNVVGLVILIGAAGLGAAGTYMTGAAVPVIAGLIAGLVLMQAPRVAQQWERAVVLRLGRFIGLRGPGLFWVVPFVDRVPAWIDQRTVTTTFAAEQTLTLDTVPVNVDAVLFWLVHDAQKAALEVQDYAQAVSWAAQTALRDIIGRTTLAELQDAMSREAQAAREKQARIILGEAELAVAQSFEQASRVYEANPTALHLRGMNMLYEGLKEKGALMIVPSSAVDTMGLGGLYGAAALRRPEAAVPGTTTPR